MLLSVLLLEDDPGKKNRLLAFLTSKKGALFEKVDTALSVADALHLLRTTRYDLFIVDVIVPSVLGGSADEEHSMALFSQLDEGVGVERPRYAVAISASQQLSAKAKDFFIGRPWGILPYSDSDDGCLATLEKISLYIIRRGREGMPERACDVFMLTALMDPEFTAIERMPFAWAALEPLDELQFIRYGKLEVGASTKTVAAAFSPRMGAVASAVLVSKVLVKLRPRLVIMCGICAGISGKADIGDVIAADISWDWQSGKFIDKDGKEHFEIAPDQIPIDEESRSRLMLLKRDSAFWNSLGSISAKLSPPQKIPKLVIGPIATGSAVLADVRVSDRIKETQHRNLAGLDMEVYGAYAAARAGDRDVRFMAMKAVCDKGDKQKDDQFQEYAAEVSARAAVHFLSNYAEPLLSD